MLFKTVIAAALIFTSVLAAPAVVELDDEIVDPIGVNSESVALEGRALKTYRLSWTDQLKSGQIKSDGTALAGLDGSPKIRFHTFATQLSNDEGNLCVVVTGYSKNVRGYRSWLYFGGGNKGARSEFVLNSLNNVLSTGNTYLGRFKSGSQFCARLKNTADGSIAELSVDNEIVHANKYAGKWSNIYLQVYISRIHSINEVLKPINSTSIEFKAPTYTAA